MIKKWIREPNCPEAKKVNGVCEGGQIVYPPTAYDLRVGESRRLHIACPIHY